MDPSPEVDDSGTKKKHRRRNNDRSGRDIRRSGRARVQRADTDSKSDSERRNKGQKCIRWTTLEKQLLLRTLKEKTPISQFNYLSIKRLVKTKKQGDVEIYIRNLRRRAMRAKVEAIKKKSPIEIWHDLMNHFGDADQHSMKDMSKVMVMASLERTINCEAITSDDFKPFRVYRYIGALFKSKELPTLTPLESQVILDCFENMLEVLRGSEIKDKAAFLRSQYTTLYNRAFTGGSNYSLEDNLSLVYKETEADGYQPHSSSSSSQPGTDPTTCYANPGTSTKGTMDSVPGTSHTVPKTSGVEPNKSSPRKKALWRGGVGRSTEVRILNPLGIPVEMLEFKHRGEESHQKKQWTYEYEDDSSDSDDSYSDEEDDEGDDSSGIEKQNGQVRRTREGNGREDGAGTDEDDVQDPAGNGEGEPNGLQDMTALLDTDQYAFVTEDEFARKGKIYLQAMTEAHAESDGHLDVSELVDSDEYVFVAKDDLEREGEGFVQSLEETGGGGGDASHETRELEDIALDASIAMDETHVGLDAESERPVCSSALFESEQYEIDGQFENDDSFGDGNTASEIDQSEVIDGSMDQSDFVDNDIGRSDGDIDPNQPDELGVEMSLSDDEESGANPIEDTLPTTDSTIPPTPPPSESKVGDDVIHFIPSKPARSQPEQPSHCENSMEVLTAVSLSSNKATVSSPVQTNASRELPNQSLVSKSSSLRRIHDADIASASTSSVPPHWSEAPGSVKNRAVQLLLPQKESQSYTSSSQGTPGYLTSNTIPLVSAIDRGLVSSDPSDDQLLTIDVSQLGPDSNIVIPSYLLPGGILTIRSPEVTRTRIQRPDTSPFVQTETNSVIANTHLFLSSQSQVGISPTSLLQDEISADMGLEKSAPPLSLQTETNSASSNKYTDLSLKAQVGISQTSQLSDNISANISPASDVESSSEDAISQTEYVIASDHPSKESDHLCEVHVIANHILKPSNQAEVPLQTSPKALHITKKQETSPKVLQISKKSENFNKSKGLHSEDVQPEMEDRSFLEFLSSQKSAWGGRKESTMPKGHVLEENGVGNSELEGQHMQVQAVHSVNIPISKSAGGKSFIGVGKTNVCHPLKISLPTTPDQSEILKHKDESPPTASSQPDNQVSLSKVGQETPYASGLKAIVIPKKKVGRPPKVREETSAIPGEVIENQAITDQGNSSTLGEKCKRGSPSKPKSIINERSLLVSKMQQGVGACVNTEGKRKRGRPLKTNKKVLVVLEDSVLESVETQEPTAEDLDKQEAIVTSDGRGPVSERNVGEKKKPGRPPKGVTAKSGISPKIQRHTAEDLDEQEAISTVEGSNPVSERNVGEKRKPGRPPKGVAAKSGISPEIQRHTAADLDEQEAIATVEGSNHVSESIVGEKRKPGRPPKRVEAKIGICFQEERKMESNVVNHSFSMSSLKSQGRMISVGQPQEGIRQSIKVTFTNIKETLNEPGEAVQVKVHNEKRKRGRPPKEQNAGTSLQSHDPPISAQTLLEGSTQKEKGNKELLPTAATHLQRKVPNSKSGDFGWIQYQPGTDFLLEVQQKRKRGRASKGLRPDSVEDLQNNAGLSQSIAKEAGGGQLGTESGTERKEKRKRGRPRKETQPAFLDDLKTSPVVQQLAENEQSNGQLGTESGTERKEKRKRGRPRKESRPDSCDDLPDRVVTSQLTGNEAGTGQFETYAGLEREEIRQTGSPRKEFSPYRPNINSPRSENREKQNTAIRPKSIIVVQPRVIAHTSTVGRSSIDTTNSKSERMTELNRSPFKQDKTSTDILETDAMIHREEKRKRGRPCKGSRTDSLVGVQKSMVKQKSTENEIGIGQLEIDSLTEVVEKRKRGRPRKEARPDSCDDLRDRIAASQVTENEEGIGQFETVSKVGREEKVNRCPTELIPYQLKQLTDVSTRINQLKTVSGTVKEEKRKRGRPRKELTPNLSDNLLNLTAITQSSEGDWFDSIGQSEIYVQTESEENEKKGRPSNDLRPCSTDRVTTNPSVENKTSVSPSRIVTVGPEKPERGRPRGNVRTDQTTKLTADTDSESGKRIKKRGRPRKEFQVDAYDDLHRREVQGLSREHDTNDSHFEQQEKQKRDKPCKELSPGSSDEHTRETETHSAEKETSVVHSQSLTGREEKQKRGRPRKLGRPDGDSGSERPEKRKRGRPSKTVDTMSSNIVMGSSVMTNQSPDKEVSMHHIKNASGADGVGKQKQARTCLEASADSRNDSHHKLDIPQPINSGTNNSVRESGQEIEGNGTRWRPLERLGFASTSQEMSVSKPLPTTDLRMDPAPSKLEKRVTFYKYLSSKELGTHQALGKSPPGILKKRKKRSPLKVNVGKELANKKQKSLYRTEQSQASPVRSGSTPLAKPLPSAFHASGLLFGKPKKRVSFEDAIDLMGNLSEDEGLGKDLFMKDIVSHTAMKEVMKIVKQVRVGRESIAEAQPPRKTSVFFSIKKSGGISSV